MQREKLNLIVLNILNTNELFNFEWKFDEDSFKMGISLDANSYFYCKAPSCGLQLKATFCQQSIILMSHHTNGLSEVFFIFN